LRFAPLLASSQIPARISALNKRQQYEQEFQRLEKIGEPLPGVCRDGGGLRRRSDSIRRTYFVRREPERATRLGLSAHARLSETRTSGPGALRDCLHRSCDRRCI
jgi:hypothetical protein